MTEYGNAGQAPTGRLSAGKKVIFLKAAVKIRFREALLQNVRLLWKDLPRGYSDTGKRRNVLCFQILLTGKPY